MSSIGGIGSVAPLAAPAASDRNVFRRAGDESEKPNGSGAVASAPGATEDPSAVAAGGEGRAPRAGPRKLKPVEQREVDELVVRDRQVRAHEAAHQAAGGSLAGAATFSYQVGPDGKSYAVGGEVPVDMSGGSSPQETIARAEQVRAAALAPVDPSAQDLAVAAQATAMENAAREQLAAATQLQAQAGNAGKAGIPPGRALPPAGPGPAPIGETPAAAQADSPGLSAAQRMQRARLAALAYRR